MSKAEVLKVMGQPTSTRAEGGVEYLVFRLSEGLATTLGPDGRPWTGPKLNDYYVRLKNGEVDSYGRVGDFDSTKIPETKHTINVNVNDGNR